MSLQFLEADPGFAYDILLTMGREQYMDVFNQGMYWKITLSGAVDCDEPSWERMAWREMREVIYDATDETYPLVMCPHINHFQWTVKLLVYSEIPGITWLFKNIVGSAYLIESIERIPWQDFCDVRRQMCQDIYYLWRYEIQYEEELEGAGPFQPLIIQCASAA